MPQSVLKYQIEVSGILLNLLLLGYTISKAYRKEKKRMLDRLSLILVIIGALNWGSVGLFRFDLVAWICGGAGTVVARIIYTIIALAGIWCISLLFRTREQEYGNS